MSLSKEDTQMIRRNMHEDSYDENSNHSSMMTSREASMNAAQHSHHESGNYHRRDSRHYPNESKRHSFATTNSNHQARKENNSSRQ